VKYNRQKPTGGTDIPINLKAATSEPRPPSGVGSISETSAENELNEGQVAVLTPDEQTEVDEAAALLAEQEKLKDQLLRTAADFDNFRKRTRRDLEDAKRRSKEEMLRDLLPVFDSLERATAAAKEAKDIQTLVEGVAMVLKLFQDTGDRMGLKRLPTVGERFDPAIHEAIQEIESNQVAPGTVIAEVQPGYRLGEYLLRAAVVVVARAPKNAARSEEKSESIGDNSEEGVS